MRLKLRIILIISFGCVCFIIALDLISDKINRHPNNFVRLFPPHVSAEYFSMKLPADRFKIAGLMGDNIFLQEKKDIVNVLMLNLHSKSKKIIKLGLERQIENTKHSSFKLYIDSSRFFLISSDLSIIYEGFTNGWKADKVKSTFEYLAEVKPLGGGSFLVRVFNKTYGFILGKWTKSSDRLQLFPELLNIQNNEPLSTDGMIHYDSKTSKIVYIHYYNNNITCLDTNFNLLFITKTIDTIAKSKIKTNRTITTGDITMATPPLTVNKRSCVSNGYLFVNSSLMATNENIEYFNRSSVIDVYSLKNGKYKLSFYISPSKGDKLKEFKVDKKMLVVLYEHSLHVYKLNF